MRITLEGSPSEMVEMAAIFCMNFDVMGGEMFDDDDDDGERATDLPLWGNEDDEDKD